MSTLKEFFFFMIAVTVTLFVCAYAVAVAAGFVRLVIWVTTEITIDIAFLLLVPVILSIGWKVRRK